MITAQEQRIVDLTKELVRRKIQGLPALPFNCSYMWGHVSIPRPGSKMAVVKVCFGSVDCDQSKAKEIASSVPGVTISHFNMD